MQFLILFYEKEIRMGIRTKFNPLGAFEKKAYKKGAVIFESNIPGSYQFDLLYDGRYLVYCIAGGAGALRNNMNKSYTYQQVSIGGGSGSAFIGELRIPAGNIPISVGRGGTGQAFYNSSLNYGVDSPALNGGESTIGALVRTPAATGGSTGRDQMNISRGGSTPIISVEIISEELRAAGNNGQAVNRTTSSVAGGAALYEEYGKGGDVIGTAPQHRTPGYVKIVYLGK